MPGIQLKTEPRRSTKVNLDKGGHFFIPRKAERHDTDAKCDLYIDLASGEFSLGTPFVTEMFSDASGTTVADVRSLTGHFGGTSPRSIDVLCGCYRKVHNAFGSAYTALREYGDAKRYDMKHNMEEIVQDPKAVLLIVQACAASTKVEKNPTLQSAIEQLSVILSLSL